MTADTTAASQLLAERLENEAITRRAGKQVRLEQQRELSDPRENTQVFLQTFGERLAGLSTSVTDLESDSASKGSQEPTCNALLDSLLELEQQTSQAAYYLPQYDLRQCMASIQALRQRVEAARAASDPKRKFTFRSKVARGKATSSGLDAAAKDQQQQQQQQQQQTSSLTSTTSTSPASNPFVSIREAWPASVSEQDLQLIAAGHGIMGRTNATIHLNTAQLEGSDFVLANLQHCNIHLLGRMPALRIQGLSHCTVTAGPVTSATFIDGAENCTFRLASYQVRIHHVTSTTFRLRTRSRPIIERCHALLFGPLLETLTPPPPPPPPAAASVTPAAAKEQAAARHADAAEGAAARVSSAAAATSTTTAAAAMAPSPVTSGEPQAAAAAAAEQGQQLEELVGLLAAAQLSEDGGQWRHVDDFDWVKATPSPNWQLLASS